MDTMKYVLDSNICIHFMKGEFDISTKISSVGLSNCYISELTNLELLCGIANSSSSKKSENKLKLNQFLAGFEDRILPIRFAFDFFTEQKTVLRRSGTPISDFDLLIGYTALSQNFIMVSRNIKEMKRINGLVYENWID